MLFALFVNTPVIQCQDVDMEDGYHIFRYPNGNVSSEGYIRDGKPDGYWISYYVTGIKKSEGKRTNFLLDSLWIFYDHVGDTLEKISYLYGKKNGYYEKYDKDPSYGLYIESRELYAGDIKQGQAYLYYPDGTIKQIIPYSQGKKEGLSKEFNREGDIITLYEYSNDYMVTRRLINRTDREGMRQGDWVSFHDNGNIFREMTYRDNVIHGYYREYDSRGNPVSIMLYDNGRVIEGATGETTGIDVVNRYNDEGSLIYRGPYRDGTPVGIHREYDDDGNISKAKIYSDEGKVISEGIIDETGNRTGAWKDFYNNGKIQAEGQYNNNRRTGLWRFYSREGNVEQTGSYNNGRADGLWTWYYDDGSLRREEDYYLGRRDGSYTEYDDNGAVIATGQYLDGERNGEWSFAISDHIEEGRYIIGLREGLWQAYYPDGKPKFKGSYVQGNADGIHYYYYPNGRIMEERYYRMGLRERTWRKYSEEGIQMISISYRSDNEVAINGVRIRSVDGQVRIIK